MYYFLYFIIIIPAIIIIYVIECISWYFELHIIDMNMTKSQEKKHI